jgi:hypothetical protein
VHATLHLHEGLLHKIIQEEHSNSSTSDTVYTYVYEYAHSVTLLQYQDCVSRKAVVVCSKNCSSVTAARIAAALLTIAVVA